MGSQEAGEAHEEPEAGLGHIPLHCSGESGAQAGEAGNRARIEGRGKGGKEGGGDSRGGDSESAEAKGWGGESGGRERSWGNWGIKWRGRKGGAAWLEPAAPAAGRNTNSARRVPPATPASGEGEQAQPGTARPPQSAGKRPETRGPLTGKKRRPSSTAPR